MEFRMLDMNHIKQVAKLRRAHKLRHVAMRHRLRVARELFREHRRQDAELQATIAEENETKKHNAQLKREEQDRDEDTRREDITIDNEQTNEKQEEAVEIVELEVMELTDEERKKAKLAAAELPAQNRSEVREKLELLREEDEIGKKIGVQIARIEPPALKEIGENLKGSLGGLIEP